jgi:hypothetical protein
MVSAKASWATSGKTHFGDLRKFVWNCLELIGGYKLKGELGDCRKHAEIKGTVHQISSNYLDWPLIRSDFSIDFHCISSIDDKWSWLTCKRGRSKKVSQLYVRDSSCIWRTEKILSSLYLEHLWRAVLPFSLGRVSVPLSLQFYWFVVS